MYNVFEKHFTDLSINLKLKLKKRDGQYIFWRTTNQTGNIAEGDANKLNSVVLDINFMSLYAYWYSPPQHYQVLMWSLKKSNLPTIPLKHHRVILFQINQTFCFDLHYSILW